jgi:superfamily II DNA or RNA helicase
LLGDPRVQLRFDRGTILIAPAASGIDPAQLPGVAWDPRVRAWRAAAASYALLVDELSRSGVRFSDTTPRHEARVAGASAPDLRWYQREALAAWAAAGRRGVITLPTGAGKTIVAAAAMAREAVATLCLVPTCVLLDQWAAALSRYLGDIGRLGDGERHIMPITVATYASAVTWAPRVGDRFGLVIVDEAHHVGGHCPTEVLEMLVAPARLGLTATPPAGNAAVVLERHVGPVVYALGIDDLVGDALADFDLITIPIRLTPAERARYDAARARFSAAFRAFQRTSPGADWESFARAAMRSEPGRAALAAWRTSRALVAFPEDKHRVVRELLTRHAAQRVLVFTGDNRTAYAIARELLVYPITHEIGRKERAHALERFNAGEANALVSSQVLDEGFDVPAAEVAIVVGGTASTRRHVQRIGRVLRPAPGKRARVYELAVAKTVEVDHVRRRRSGMALYGTGAVG